MNKHTVDETSPIGNTEIRHEKLLSSSRRFRIFGSVTGYVVPPAIALVLAAIVWELWIQINDVPVYIVPPPSDVLSRLAGAPGFFAKEGAMTLSEALAGFVLGSAVALVGATLMSHSRFLERSLLPIAILVKVTPIVAIAPLFVIWFGFGMMPKVFIAGLISFFPVLVNGITGFRSVDPKTMDFLRSLKASEREIFFNLRLPSSLPYLFTAFRVAVPLAVIGAVVAEWFSADRGLGSVIIVAHSNLDMVTLFGAIFTLAIIGIGLTVVLSLIERKVLFWHESSFVV